MAKLIYAMATSLDGYVADEEGKFDWAAPDEEVHRFFNDLERPIGIHLYGRRMYEMMRFWQDPGELETMEPVMRDYAEIWQGADKVVYSRSIGQASTARTRIAPPFDPEAGARLKETATADLSIGGPTIAAEALRAGLGDELHQVVFPVIVGGGTAFLPDGLHLDLELLGERRFSGGAVHLGYRVR